MSKPQEAAVEKPGVEQTLKSRIAGEKTGT